MAGRGGTTFGHSTRADQDDTRRSTARVAFSSGFDTDGTAPALAHDANMLRSWQPGGNERFRALTTPNNKSKKTLLSQGLFFSCAAAQLHVDNWVYGAD
jgi:hypothetical protein